MVSFTVKVFKFAVAILKLVHRWRIELPSAVCNTAVLPLNYRCIKLVEWTGLEPAVRPRTCSNQSIKENSLIREHLSLRGWHHLLIAGPADPREFSLVDYTGIEPAIHPLHPEQFFERPPILSEGTQRFVSYGGDLVSFTLNPSV